LKYSLDKQAVKSALIVLAVLLVFAGLVVSGYVKVEGIWFIFSFSEIRITTMVVALACFAFVLYLNRKNTLKSLYYASLTVVFSMSLFEIVWYFSAATFKGWDLHVFQFAALFGWVALGIREVFKVHPKKISIALYLVFAVSFVLWIASGFSFNDPGYFSFSITGEVFNVTAKTSLFLGYAFHIGKK
jgi:hypothetical protein